MKVVFGVSGAVGHAVGAALTRFSVDATGRPVRVLKAVR